MDTAFIKHIEDSLPLTQDTLVALCDYLKATGWTHIAERHYSKVFDDTEPVQVRVPASPTQPTPTDAAEAFAEIVSLLALSRPLEELLLDIKARTQQVQGANEFSTHHTATYITEAGVIIVDDPKKFGICVRLEPKDALQHAEYLLRLRAELEQLQQRLEQRWHDVALEVKQRFEEENEDGLPFSEATEQDIQRTLENVSGQDRRGYFVDEPTSPAGWWYRSLWDAEGQDTTTFEQQWTPFLRVCHELQIQDGEEDKETDLYDDRTAPRDTDYLRYE